MKFKSTLKQITSEVFSATTLTEGKLIVNNHIGGTGIKDTDKKTILRNVNNINELGKLQYYICNSLLKFEGLGLI
tara:strand:+ start:318 stop:542 length:225 start_codon:yes stop_codon:yes gene_type:complete